MVSELRPVERPRQRSSARPGQPDEITRLGAGGRRRRLGLAAIGGLFILVAALIGASLFTALRSSVSVLALQTDIAAGDVLDVGDLVAVELGADGLGQLSYLSVERQNEIVGLTALGPLPAGSLVSAAMFGERGDIIPAGQAVIGVVLDRGALPAGIVQPGDEVDLIAAVGSVQLTDEAVAEVIGRGRIWMIEPATELERGTSVSVVVASELVPAVAQAAADERLRIGLVGQ